MKKVEVYKVLFKSSRQLLGKSLVVRILVYKTNVGSSNPIRADLIFNDYKKLFLFGKLYFFLTSACF